MKVYISSLVKDSNTMSSNITNIDQNMYGGPDKTRQKILRDQGLIDLIIQLIQTTFPEKYFLDKVTKLYFIL